MSENVSSFNLPTRSEKAPRRLSEVICLRCAKSLADNSPESCEKNPNQCCLRCAKLHKFCDKIPVFAIKGLNRLLKVRRAIYRRPELNENAVAQLRQSTKEWRKKTEAAIRAERKRGLRHAPRGPDEIGLLMVKELAEIASIIAAGVNSFRAVHNMPPLNLRDGDDHLSTPSTPSTASESSFGG